MWCRVGGSRAKRRQIQLATFRSRPSQELPREWTPKADSKPKWTPKAETEPKAKLTIILFH